ncbi:MAG TPA: SRPBCC family protein [Solirubrobacteraceae bacterium]|nr:SRPBCC family protein [Solirubrobacteraceae bacterium]
MPTARRTRTIAASAQELWEVLGDPHHLPRWWPRVNRVEAVTLTGTPRDGGQAGELGAFTEVLMSPRGRIVRADFKLLDAVEPWRIVWSQQIENTPFARVLKSAETEICLAAAHGSDGPATEVTIELRQVLQGFRGSGALSLRFSGISRFGGPLVQRAAVSTIEEALDGLELIAGRRS